MILLTATWEHADAWTRGDLIGFWSLVFGVLAVIVAIFTLRRGNKNSSVASMIPLNAEIREMWDQYTASITSIAFTSLQELEVLELEVLSKLERLMNVLEIAAAIEVEGTLSGVSRVLMRDHLERLLNEIMDNDYTSAQVSRLFQDETTYIFIRRFLKKNAPLSTALPPQWYVYPNISWLQRAKSFFRY
jgi:hypothetical protein